MTTSEQTNKKLYPAVAMYGPYTVKNVKEGEQKLWCACGLSKQQPWCDGSHKGTGIKPVKWTINKAQRLYQICACKYTKDPPYCDATHTNLPTEILDRQENCEDKAGHEPTKSYAQDVAGYRIFN